MRPNENESDPGRVGKEDQMARRSVVTVTAHTKVTPGDWVFASDGTALGCAKNAAGFGEQVGIRVIPGSGWNAYAQPGPASVKPPAASDRVCDVCYDGRGRMFGGWTSCRHGWEGQLRQLEAEQARLRSLLWFQFGQYPPQQ